jgi:hypothetical protein
MESNAAHSRQSSDHSNSVFNREEREAITYTSIDSAEFLPPKGTKIPITNEALIGAYGRAIRCPANRMIFVPFGT